MDVSKLIQLMKKQKISQRELAAKIGMSHVGLNNAIKSGDFKVSTLEKIARALGVPVSYFFGESEGVVVNGHFSGNRIENSQVQIQLNQAQAEIKALRAELAACRESLQSKNEQIQVLKEMIQMLKEMKNDH